MNEPIQRELTEHLFRHMSDDRKNRLQEVAENRTNYVTMILEDIHKANNSSATIRTCECLGVQTIHIIENTTSFSVNKDITIGSSKWINLHRYNEKNKNNTEVCFETLKNNGYKIIAMTPNSHNRTLDDLSFDTKPAFLFGNEESGLTEYALNEADDFIKLPMYGFTQSYNITVSAAITMSYAVNALRNSDIRWQLTEAEQKALILEWCRKTVRRSDLIEELFLSGK